MTADPANTRILVVEDDEAIGRTIERILQDAGYKTLRTREGRQALGLAVKTRPDLIMLDLILELGGDGLTVCRQIRAQSEVAETPIVILTGTGGVDVEEQLFAAGADDFLRKQDLHPKILIRRVEAVLRRSQAGGGAQLQIGPLHLDLTGRSAMAEDRVLDLTPMQFDILARLAAAKGEVVPRDKLLGRVEGGGDADASKGNSANVHVLALRRKLAPHDWMIQTVRGAGYRMCLEPPAEG